MAHLWQLCTQNESVTSSAVSQDAQMNFFFTNLSCLIQFCSLAELKGLVELKGYLIQLMEVETLNKSKK